MSDAECWKLNRMRQLEDDNIHHLQCISELEAELKKAQSLVAALMKGKTPVAALEQAERRGFEAATNEIRTWALLGSNEDTLIRGGDILLKLNRMLTDYQRARTDKGGAND